MKRIRMILIGVLAALAVSAVGASSASAGSVSMHIRLTSFGLTAINCDATFVTTGGPPLATTTIVGWSMSGSCLPDVTVDNDPVVTFSGSGPWTGNMNSFQVTSASAGCGWIANSIQLTSTSSSKGPYNGQKSAPGTTCPFVPGQLYLTNMVFS